VPDDTDVAEQIEWIDTIVARDRGKLKNPAGMYVSFVKEGITPPPSFLSSRRRKQIQAAELERGTDQATLANRRLELDIRYSEYREQQVRAYIDGLTAEAKSKLMKDSRKMAAKHVSHFDTFTSQQQDDLANRFALNIVLNEIPILNKEEFSSREQFTQLSFPSSVGL
jgi:hypothetical protein